MTSQQTIAFDPNRIRAVIADVLGVSPEHVAGDGVDLDDLGVDSLDAIELIMALENEFQVELLDEDVEDLTTVGELVALVQEAAR